MKAAIGTPNGLEIHEVQQPRLKPAEVLVRVEAAGLNRADLMAARSGSPVGLEWAGEVVEVGAEVKTCKPGDRVMCNGSGGYAEYAVTDHGRVMPIPSGLDIVQAACLPVALLTLHNALVTNGRLKAGESVLIQGASSGVGIMGLKIAKHMGAKLVIGSSTTAARRERLKEHGADIVIDSSDPDWPDQVLEATGGNGVNVIVDMISGPVANQNMKAASILGRIVNVGRLGGARGEFDFDLHALRRIDYIGVTFRTRSIDEIRELVDRMKADLWDAVARGKLNLPIDRTYPLSEAAAAQAHMRNNEHFGKIALTM